MKEYTKPDEALFWLEGVMPILAGCRESSLIGYPIYPGEVEKGIGKAKRFVKPTSPNSLYLRMVDHQSISKIAQKELNNSELGKKLGEKELEFRVILRTGFLDKSCIKVIFSYDVFVRRKNVDEERYDALENLYEELITASLSRPSEWQVTKGELFYPYKPSILSIAENIDKINGGMLSYPTCCREGYINSKRDGPFSPEIAYGRQLWENEENFLFLEEIVNGGKAFLKEICEGELPEVMYSTPYMGFYPCRIDCKRAIEIGKKLKKFSQSVGMSHPCNFKCLITPLWHFCIGFEHSRKVKREHALDGKVKEMKKFLFDGNEIKRFAYLLIGANGMP